jgi:hypothetical protein
MIPCDADSSLAIQSICIERDFESDLPTFSAEYYFVATGSLL